jgi:hypothetical protein
MRPGFLTSVTLSLTLFVPAAANAAPKKGEKKGEFTCTHVMGVSVTGDWFGAGFESGNDDARWQAQTRHHGFVHFWADPKDAIWSEPVVSPCAKNSDKPDRVILTTVNWEYATTEEWVATITKAVKTLKDKWPGVKRIELLTIMRGPGNKTCGNDKMTVVQPILDEAQTKVAAAFPKLVTVGPKFEAPSCEVFTKGGPHYTPEGMAKAANVYASHYLK